MCCLQRIVSNLLSKMGPTDISVPKIDKCGWIYCVHIRNWARNQITYIYWFHRGKKLAAFSKRIQWDCLIRYIQRIQHFISKMSTSEKWCFFKKAAAIKLCPIPHTSYFPAYQERKQHDIPCEIVPSKKKKLQTKAFSNQHYWRKLGMKSVARSSPSRSDRYFRTPSFSSSSINEFKHAIPSHFCNREVSEEMGASTHVLNEENISEIRDGKSHHEVYQLDHCHFRKQESRKYEQKDFLMIPPYSFYMESTDSQLKSIDDNLSRLRIFEEEDFSTVFAQLRVKGGKAIVIYRKSRSVNLEVKKTCSKNNERQMFQVGKGILNAARNEKPKLYVLAALEKLKWKN
jgi:hypothetical protein